MEEKYMEIAIKEAKKAMKLGEIPVGAVVVYKNKVIGKGYNKKEKTKNSLMHAEILAINNACKSMKDWRLNECEIYVTMEPCIMCMGAILESRIKTVYYGAINKKSHEYNLKISKKEKIKMEYGKNFQKISEQINEFFKSIRVSKQMFEKEIKND